MNEPESLVINNVTYQLSGLSPEEKLRLQHLKLHELHRGHEKMHLEMFLIAMFCLFVCQMLLMLWKRYHFKTYQLATLLAMWMVPFVYSLFAYFPRFITIWMFFSLITGTMAYLASKKRINTNTPRRVYRWFLFIHKLSYGLGILGYALIVAALFQLNTLFLVSNTMAIDTGLLTMFYGLYYGVIARDFAEVCSDKMAAQIGYHDSSGIPKRRIDPTVCSICTNALFEENGEKIYRLNCTHVFHDFCIRGWCIVGKKDTCPYCKEKVDLKRMFQTPWEKPDLLYASLLDWVRYLVAWQPVILGMVHVINRSLGLK